MKEESKTKLAVAGVSATAAVITALITTIGAIIGSQSKVAELLKKADTAAKSFAQISAPPGAILAYAGPLDEEELRQAGWLLCDGRTLKREGEYARLFHAVGTVWGHGDTLHTFNLPDLRGLFLRGVSGERSDSLADPDPATRTNALNGGSIGNQVGSIQRDDFKRHIHRIGITANIAEIGKAIGGAGPNLTETTPDGGNETRPKNAYVHYIIRF
jgi:hypothetical protein